MVEVIEKMTSNVLFVGFALLFLGFIMCCYFTYQAQYGTRKFHYASLMINGCAALAYLYMASKSGYLIRADDGRVFFWARYVDWVITTPLLLFDLGGVAGAELGEVFGIIGLDVLMIVAGLIGGIMGPEYRWIFWAFGMFCFVPIIYMLLQTFKDQMQDLNLKRKDTYGKMMSITVITWIAYPVVWALGEGAGMLEQTIEVLLYVILDVIAKTVFSFILLQAHESFREEGGSL